MTRRHAILGRSARLFGFLGLGMSALLGAANAMGGITRDAAESLAVATLHANLKSSDGKLFLIMDRILLERGKGADQGLGKSTSVTPASRAALFVPSAWTWAPNPKESALPGLVLDASPPQAPLHPAAVPENQTNPGSASESRSDDSGAPNESSGNPKLAAYLSGIMRLPSHLAPQFMAYGLAPTSKPKPAVTGSFCVGFLGLSLAGQDEQLNGRRGRGCERSQKGPASHSILYLRIPLL